MIKKIIELLSNEEISLDASMSLFKDFASALGNSSLYNWANNEINGYQLADEMPTYRTINAVSMATLQVGYIKHENQPLPVALLGSDIAQILNNYKIVDGIKAVEEIAFSNVGDYISKSFDQSFCNMLTQRAYENGVNFNIVDAKLLIKISDFKQLLNEIRLRSLEFAMKIVAKDPALLEMSIIEIDKVIANETIAQVTLEMEGEALYRQKIRRAKINTEIDIETLRLELNKYNINIADVNKFDNVPETDVLILNQHVETRTKFWLSKILDKVIFGPWDVTVPALGGISIELFVEHFIF
jgi:hypothetical protein